MANDPEEKQPSASSPSEPSGAKPSAAGGEPVSKVPAPPAAKPPAAVAPPRPPAILEAWVDRKQSILVVARELLAEICMYSRDDEKFDWLSDLTAADWPKREKRFDIVLNLYSFEENERLRLKAQASADERVPSVQGIWATANWMEREVYDMFGVVFEGHPDLKRILLPDEWQGFPLRKDYDILTQDTAWVRENLGIESGQ